MKIPVLLLAIPLAAAVNQPRTPVLVELFTSEGCSSCPPADALLSEIRRAAPDGVEVIALSEHVDYWNRLGWPDPFSSPQFSERQQAYARQFRTRGPYTPQMVVDGRREFVGSDRGELTRALREAGARPKARLEVAVEGDEVVVRGAEGLAKDADVWMAITEDGLVIPVKRGENGGRTLKHDGVTRRLKRLGKDMRAPLDLDANWTGPLRVAVFAQHRRTGEIVAAAAASVRP